MPTCSNEELRAVFGQARHFFAEGQDPSPVIECRVENSKFLKRTSRLAPFRIMRHFFQKAVPHARLPVFNRLSPVQGTILFWKKPKHDQTPPKPA
jgi:hypothetical protein